MRILQVIPYFYPAWKVGGSVKVAYDISRKLVERGHSITVYTSDIKDGWKLILNELNGMA
jgi:glycogen synthase